MTDSRPLLVANLRAVAPRWAFPEWAAQMLGRDAPPGWRVHVVSTPTISDGDGGGEPSDELLDAMADAHAYAGFGISRDLFEGAPRLRWVHSAAAGVGSALFDEMRRSDVVLTNSAGIHGVPIAEHVLAGVLYFLRSFDIAVERQRQGVWERDSFVGESSTMRELADCRALVIGAGGIGGEIGRRLTMLGCRCTGVRRRPELGIPAGFDRVVGVDDWRALLPDMEIVVLSVPATRATRQLIGAVELSAMRPDAILVNIARGTLLDEDALSAALHGGRLRGAMLDVFAREPLDSASPLWKLPNVLITPHVSGVTSGRFWERQMALLMENWHRFATGRALRNVVDKQAGY